MANMEQKLERVKLGLIAALKNAKRFHENSDFHGIEKIQREYESLCHDFFPDFAPEENEVGVWIEFGRRFLEAWSDSANHWYQYYEPISKTDWPNLTDQIIIALENGMPYKPLELNGKPLGNL